MIDRANLRRATPSEELIRAEKRYLRRSGWVSVTRDKGSQLWHHARHMGAFYSRANAVANQKEHDRLESFCLREWNHV